MKDIIKDLMEVNWINGATFAWVNLTDIQTVSNIILALTSAICTVVWTVYKIRKSSRKDED